MEGAIVWNVRPELFQWGIISIRWYGALFAAAFLVASFLESWIFKREKKPVEYVERMVIYAMIGAIVGSRLAECVFYNPAYYFANPLEIFKIWKGGLASHGTVTGIFIGLWLFMRKTSDISYMWLLDRASIAIALGISFIRIGNFFNSEIIGKPTGSSWGVIFSRIDNIPRHPTQLYESFCYFMIFLLLLFMYRKINPDRHKGLLFGTGMTAAWLMRFLIEFIKENQVAFESGWTLNMGQRLTIPFFLIGVAVLIKYFVSWRNKPS